MRGKKLLLAEEGKTSYQKAGQSNEYIDGSSLKRCTSVSCVYLSPIPDSPCRDSCLRITPAAPQCEAPGTSSTSATVSHRENQYPGPQPCQSGVYKLRGITCQGYIQRQCFAKLGHGGTPQTPSYDKFSETLCFPNFPRHRSPRTSESGRHPAHDADPMEPFLVRIDCLLPP